MTKDIERERKAFEERFQHLDLDFVDDLGYCESETQIAWASWCAAKAHEAEKLKGCVVVPVEPTDAMIDAFEKLTDGSSIQDVWTAMLEAARGGKDGL
ncbi:hypothetical protein [Acinetobacter venetianus]|uniref:hypothetical protein n=1 Tax=Acinetobacter venetianus TaxID=52133 RepID=UPI0007788A28|nr:hypothetical protein [Acinetobacter venetianus]KXZ65574.1 hypothetical protein AVENLUH7437_01351 [Acinetobacter venetianus]